MTETGNGITRLFTVFNPTPNAKDETVEITVWDWPGDMRYAKVTDADGKDLEFQLLTGIEHYWDHKYFKMLVKVKACGIGYTTVVLMQQELPGLYPVYFLPYPAIDPPHGNIVLENEFLRAEFDYTNGALISLKNKADGFEYIETAKAATFVLIDTERATSDAWHIGKYIKITPVTNVTRLNAGNGNLRSFVAFDANVLGSRIHAEISLDKGSRHLSFKTEVDWNEVGGETVPVLAFALPLSYKCENYLYDVPAGAALRPAMESDVPALSFALAPSGREASAAIINDSKYGYRARLDGTLISTFINTAVSPDKYPERGIHKFTMSLALIPEDRTKASAYAEIVCRKLAYVPAASHKGTLPTSGSLFKVTAEDVTVSSVETAEDGALLVRAFSQKRDGGKLVLTFEKTVKESYAVDYLGRREELSGNISFSGNTVTAVFEGCEIITVRITF